MGFWEKVWDWTVRLNPFTAPLWYAKESLPDLGVDISGSYGGSPNVTTKQSEKTWFQKLWQTIVTVALLIALAIVLLIIFKGYRFVNQFFKLKK